MTDAEFLRRMSAVLNFEPGWHEADSMARLRKIADYLDSLPTLLVDAPAEPKPKLEPKP